MNKNLLLIGVGAALLVGGFFVGTEYKKSLTKNISQNNVAQTCLEVDKSTEVKECPVLNENTGNLFDLDSLFKNQVESFSVNERRAVSPLKNASGKITLAYVYETKDILDRENNLSYRLYRVGLGDAPPTYSAGRIFLQVTELKMPGNPVSVYDTQIDSLELEPIGEVLIKGNKLIVTCSKKQALSNNLCEYQVEFSKENYSLVVVRTK